MLASQESLCSMESVSQTVSEGVGEVSKLLQILGLYRASRGECARLRENVP
jgi:hypothetical protein